MARKLLLALAALFLLHPVLKAGENNSMNVDSLRISPKKWIYFRTGIESNLLQFVRYSTGSSTLNTIPRYTYFFNTGVDAELKLGPHLKVFSGLYLKNIGMIIKFNDSTRDKHRVYTLGLPLGIKIPLANNDISLRLGGDIGPAINYKWKHFVNGKKTKGNEYFSSETSTLFYSLFAGLTVHGVSVSASYYLNNFFTDASKFNQSNHLIVIGLGLNIDRVNFNTKSKTKEQHKAS